MGDQCLGTMNLREDNGTSKLYAIVFYLCEIDIDIQFCNKITLHEWKPENLTSKLSKTATA